MELGCFAKKTGIVCAMLMCIFYSGCVSVGFPASAPAAEAVNETVQPTVTPSPSIVQITLPPPTATPDPTPTPVPTPTPIPSIVFKNGSFPADSDEISIKLEAGETELLDDFFRLSICHFEGSTCYEEIQTFINTHPDIQVSYSIDIFGQSFPNDTENIRLQVSSTNADEVLKAFTLLPSLQKIDLNGSSLPASDCLTIGDRLGTSIINYTIKIGSEVLDSTIKEIALKEHPSVTAEALLEVIPFLPDLIHIDAFDAKDFSLEQIDLLRQSREGLVIDFPVTIFGKTFSTGEKYIDLSKKKIKAKQLDELRKIIPYMTNCEKVIMEDCGLSDEIMDQLRTELEPYTEIVWRIKCGPYTCRTDSIMIKFSGKSTVLTDSKVKGLSYCHKIKYLDLGHNHIRHIDFVSEMPDLEVCIIAVNYLVDIKPIENCKKLEYCEFLSNVSIDLTPLAECTELKHLNVSYSGVKDITPLYGLTKLERLWISRNSIPKDQIEHIKELLPAAEINTTSHNCTGEGWRENPRYDLLREQFQYDNSHIRSYYIMDGEVREDYTK